MVDRLPSVTLVVCACGPILEEALDLEAVAAAGRTFAGVDEVVRHGTLCSVDGQAWLADLVQAHAAGGGDRRYVLVGCSPHPHERTFRHVFRRAGANPFLFEMANIREQCAFIAPTREEGTRAAKDIVRGAVARVRRHQPLVERDIETSTAVLVVGAGVAGLTAARILAGAGRQVTLLERAPVVGGNIMRVGELFPNLECASCVLAPLIDEVLHHPRVELLTLAEIEGVRGFSGAFQVRIRRAPRHVAVATCYGCGACTQACPVETSSAFEAGLGRRKAVAVAYDGGLPNAPWLDESACRRFRGEDCRACADACPFGNIDLDEKPAVIERTVGSIVLATGVRDTAATGARTLSASSFERMLIASGPTGGKIVVPNGYRAGEPPRSIAVIVAGSAPGRLEIQNALKYAKLARARLPEARIILITPTIRAEGAGEERLAASVAAALGDSDLILLGAGGPAEVLDSDDSAWILLPDGYLHADIAVVVGPFAGGLGAVERDALRLRVDEAGFVVRENERLLPFSTTVRGVFAAGAVAAATPTAESAALAAGAAGAALAAFAPGERLPLEPCVAAVDPGRCGSCRICASLCPYSAISYAESPPHPASVDAALCRGCGVCGAACAAGAIVALHQTDDQIISQIEALLERDSP